MDRLESNRIGAYGEDSAPALCARHGLEVLPPLFFPEKPRADLLNHAELTAEMREYEKACKEVENNFKAIAPHLPKQEKNKLRFLIENDVSFDFMIRKKLRIALLEVKSSLSSESFYCRKKQRAKLLAASSVSCPLLQLDIYLIIGKDKRFQISQYKFRRATITELGGKLRYETILSQTEKV